MDDEFYDDDAFDGLGTAACYLVAFIVFLICLWACIP